MGNLLSKNRAFAILLICSFVFSTIAFSQTNVSGIISTDTTWIKANSPYNLIGSTQINAGVTLTIEPGVTVISQGNFFIKILGTIKAIGTNQDSIYFKSKNNISWGGLLLVSSGSVLNNDYSYASGSNLSFCSFYSATTALFLYDNNFFVSNCTFTNNGTGIEPRKIGKSIIKNCNFFNNINGIYTVQEDYSSPYSVGCISDLKIDSNRFERNTNGLNLSLNQRTFSGLIISNSVFSKNNNGLVFGGGGGMARM